MNGQQRPFYNNGNKPRHQFRNNYNGHNNKLPMFERNGDHDERNSQFKRGNNNVPNNNATYNRKDDPRFV